MICTRHLYAFYSITIRKQIIRKKMSNSKKQEHKEVIEQQIELQELTTAAQDLANKHLGGGIALERFFYDNKIVRDFAVASVFWAVVALSVGVLIAVQLFWPAANM